MRSPRLLLLWVSLVACYVDYGTLLPVAFNLGSAISTRDLVSYSNTTLTLSPDSPVLTVDYGTEAAGFPYFDISELAGSAVIQVKYAESAVALSAPDSDGPWTLASGLSNTFRVENITLESTGRTESYFLQGGQRWETVQLMTNTSISISSLGLRLTSAHVPPEASPGKMSTSNAVYNQIWDLGARVVQVACIDSGNAPSTWRITSDGAYIRGQQTAQSSKGLGLGNYTLTFSTKITSGGVGWRFVSGLPAFGAFLYLTANQSTTPPPTGTDPQTLAPNSLTFGYGFSIMNQTSLPAGPTQNYPVHVTIDENKWYNLSTAISTKGYEVMVDGVEVAFVPIAEASELAAQGSYFGTGSSTDGTWGFGAWNGQSAFVKDVVVTADNNSILYTNSMTSEDTLAEYSVAALDHSLCLDGAKRDRLVWIGDFYHTAREISSSTTRWDYILGTIDYCFSWQRQLPPFQGFVPIDGQMGARPEYINAFVGNYAGLIDYQDLFLSAIANYYWSTADSRGLQKYWPQVKALVAARLTYIDPSSGLMAGTDAVYFLGPANGSAVTGLSAYTLRKLVPLAQAYGDIRTAELYEETASKLNSALNTQLWDPSIGAYSLALGQSSNYSLTGIAWPILSGAANHTQIASMVAKIEELRLGVGYKTNSFDTNSNTTELSPNICGFLLEALFKAHRDYGVHSLTAVKTLLNSFWSPMVTQDQYYSGTAWEYLYPDGSPGIGTYTSLAHPWGAAPTYILPEYILGIAAASPGYRTWTFTPLLYGLDLDHANGTVITMFGPLYASWELDEDKKTALITVMAPAGTTGELRLPHGVIVGNKHKTWDHGTTTIRGGQEVRLQVFAH